MDFQKEVLDRSSKVPVVVDFWAPWCGPCQFLGPVIEELANEQEGKWELVKVNTDENQELSVKYGIRGIPAVKMFADGEVIADFTGALPKPQIEKWLTEHLPDPRRKALGTILRSFSEEGEGDLSKLKTFVEDNPDYADGRVALAKHIVFRNPAEALQLVEDIAMGHSHYAIAEDIRSVTELMEWDQGDNSESDGMLKDVKQHIEKQNLELAMENLIQLVVRDKNYANELPRRAAIAVFNLTGPEHPITQKFRRQFDMALY